MRKRCSSRRATWPGFIRSSRARPAIATPRSGPHSTNPARPSPRCWWQPMPTICRLRPPPEDARRNTETIEKTIPEMTELADNDLQRLALQRLNTSTVALREGFAKLSEQLSSRTALLHNTIDATQAEAIGVIDELSAKMREREQKAQATFDRTLSDISRRVLSIAVMFLGIILTVGVLIALSIRLPLQQIMTAMRAITIGDYDRKVQGTTARDEVGAMARAVEVF